MNDTQFEWLKDQLGDIAVEMKINCETYVRLDESGDKEAAEWSAGRNYGFICGLARGKVADFATLLRFQTRMMNEAYKEYFDRKEQEHERNEK